MQSRCFFHCHYPSHHRHLSVCLPRARQGSRTRLGSRLIVLSYDVPSYAFATLVRRTLRSGPADLTRSDSFSLGNGVLQCYSKGQALGHQQQDTHESCTRAGHLAECWLRQSSISFLDLPCACGLCACAMSGCGRGFHGSAFLSCMHDLSTRHRPDAPTGNKPYVQRAKILVT